MKSILTNLVRPLYYQSKSGLYKLFQWILIPLVPLYKFVRTISQFNRYIRRKSLSRPVVSIGNISIGGTGKTEFTQWLVEFLTNQGNSPVILKRGQGSRNGVVPEQSEDSQLTNYGDEVSLLRRSCPEVPIGVGPDRYKVGKKLIPKVDPDVIVLDDGFQHQQLDRDLDVVLIGSQNEIDQWELPAGPLREPFASLERADVISINMTGESQENNKKEKLMKQVQMREDQIILFHHYQFKGIFRNSQNCTEWFKKRKIYLLTTLARPSRLEHFLKKEGFRVQSHVKLPDHADIDFDRLQNELPAERTVVTEKEWGKLNSDIQEKVGIIRSEFIVENPQRLHRELTAIISRDRK